MELTIECACAVALQSSHRRVLRENKTMPQMCRQFSFHITPVPDESLIVLPRRWWGPDYGAPLLYCGGLALAARNP